jgi:protein-tyrosine phosphatase
LSFETSLNWAKERVLCFGPKPGRWRSIEQDLQLLKSVNVRGILSLVEVEPMLGAYREAGFEVLHVPVDDFNAPTIAQIEQCVEYISTNAPVYVHCYAGYGRAGTIAAAWLIKHDGLPAIDAIRTIRRLRPGAIEVDAQFHALLEYGQSLE